MLRHCEISLWVYYLYTRLSIINILFLNYCLNYYRENLWSKICNCFPFCAIFLFFNNYFWNRDRNDRLWNDLVRSGLQRIHSWSIHRSLQTSLNVLLSKTERKRRKGTERCKWGGGGTFNISLNVSFLNSNSRSISNSLSSSSNWNVVWKIEKNRIMLQKFREGGGKIKYSLPQNVTYIFIRQFVIDNVKEVFWLNFIFQTVESILKRIYWNYVKIFQRILKRDFIKKERGGKNCIFVK